MHRIYKIHDRALSDKNIAFKSWGILTFAENWGNIVIPFCDLKAIKELRS